tara:strand:- start:321 stop:2021 length:1701 start_codon:yes stop_codon:yes gene_type:complete
MIIKNKIIKSNTLSIIRHGNGFKYIGIATILTLIVTFFDIKTISLVPSLIKSISNENINNGALKFIFFALLGGILRIIFAYFSSKVNTVVSTNISNKIFETTELIDIYQLESFGVSKLSQVFSNDIQTITNELIYPILQIITSLILSISILLFLLIRIPLITIIISIIFLIIYYFFIKTSKSKIRKNSAKTIFIKDKFVQSANEIIINSRYLKTSLKGKSIREFLKTNDLSIKRMTAQNNFLSVYPKYLAESFGLISIAIIGLTSSYYGNSQILSILGILALSIQKLIPSFQSIFVAISAINCNSANIKRMNDFINLSYEKKNLSKQINIFNRIGNIRNIKNINQKEKSILLVKVNLKSKKIDHNFNFEILNNKWTGIIGASGIGKTTLMDIITGVALPFESKTSFLTSKGEFTLQKRKDIYFIYLAQFNYIPNCPIIEFIAGSTNPKYINENKKYIVKLFKSIGLFEELEYKTENDLFNNLSENASSISGGQAQRLFILRTIFEAKKNINNGYKILAMDEPFKGLDEVTKSKCIYLLKQVSKTAILITHSNKEAKNLCDIVYKIQ